MRVAFHRKCELSVAAGSPWVVVERPAIARAVVFERGGSEFAGKIGGDERPARLVAAGDQPNGQPTTLPFEVEVEAERTDRSAAASGLLRIEETEEYTRSGT